MALTLLMTADRSGWFASGDQAQRARVVPQNPHSEGVWLLPLVALLAMTLITSAFSVAIDLLYPLRVIAVGAPIV